VTPCIEYTGYLDDCGYGITGKGRAHRVAWSAVHGPIPTGLHVLHRCDNPSCINVEHLFLGTNQDNVADRDSKNRQARQHGSSNGRSFLTDEKVRRIKTLLKQGKSSLNAIAKEYNVCKSTIVHIKMGRTWREQ
jgi:hypothetical protein